jgi:glycopeptide antibiotics resistance protein
MYYSVVPTPQVRRAGWYIVAASLVVIVVATLQPEAGRSETASFCLICGPNGGVDAILNFLLFLPLGIGLAMSGTPWRRAIVALACCSALIEMAQLYFIAGRNAALGDFLTNSIGGAVGFLIARTARVWGRPTPRVALRLVLGWALWWLALQTIVSFAFTPAFPNSFYYGQIAHSFRNMATFEGKVLAADIGGTPIPDSLLPNSQALRERLGHAAAVRLVVIPAGPTSDVAPILRIADRERREILILAQKGTDVVFGVRNGGVALRLRPSLFSISNAFPVHAKAADSIADTLLLSGRYGGDAVTMQIQRKATIDARRYSLSAPLGWTLLWPAQWDVNGSALEKLLTLLWTASLLVPLGYWVTRSVNKKQFSSGSTIGIVVGLLALLAIGLLLIPFLFGLAAPSVADWLAALAGIGVGSIAVLRLFGGARTTR